MLTDHHIDAITAAYASCDHIRFVRADNRIIVRRTYAAKLAPKPLAFAERVYAELTRAVAIVVPTATIAMIRIRQDEVPGRVTLTAAFSVTLAPSDVPHASHIGSNSHQL